MSTQTILRELGKAYRVVYEMSECLLFDQFGASREL